MATAEAPSLRPDQLVAVAINAIATNASWSGLLHDAERLAETLIRCDHGEDARALLADCQRLGETLHAITQLSVQQGAELESLAMLLDSAEAGDDGGSISGD